LCSPLRESHIDAIAAILQSERQLAVKAANARLKVLKILRTGIIRQLLTTGKGQEQRQQGEKRQLSKTLQVHLVNLLKTLIKIEIKIELEMKIESLTKFLEHTRQASIGEYN